MDLLDPDTKEKIWRWDGFDSNLGNRNFVIHAILNTTFYGSDTRRLFAVNLETGATKWKIDTDWSIVSASNGALFYSSNESYYQPKAASLFKYDPVHDSHEVVFKIPAGGEWYNFLESCTSTYNENGEEILYFIQAAYRYDPFGDKTILYCYNNDTDEVLWLYATDNPMASSKPPIIDGDRVYFGTVHNMYCIEKATGALIWVEKRTRLDGYNSLYRLIDDKIIRISSEGYFKALNKMTGEVIYEHQYGTGYTDDMEYLNGRMYYADGSQLNIVDVATGERLYRWETKNKNVDEPAFINHVALDPERGVMYVSDWYYINCIKIPD